MAALIGRVTYMTEKAAKIVFVGEETSIWVPLSVCSFDEEPFVGYEGDIEIADWFAKQEGLD